MKESEITAWRGIAFEEVCFQHISQIKIALQINGVSSLESAFIIKGDDHTEGTQIDLLIDRADDVVNICEMKYCKTDYVVTKDYADKLVRRQSLLEVQQPDKTFHLTLISTGAIHQNEYADTFTSVVTLDDLFAL